MTNINLTYEVLTDTITLDTAAQVIGEALGVTLRYSDDHYYYYYDDEHHRGWTIDVAVPQGEIQAELACPDDVIAVFYSDHYDDQIIDIVTDHAELQVLIQRIQSWQSSWINTTPS